MGVAAELKVAEGIISQEQAQSYGWLEKSYKSNRFLERYNASLEDGRVFVCDAHEVLPKFLKEANLKGADLRVVDLTDARLEGADFENAILEGANLRGADLEGAILRGATLTGANLRGATVDAVSILQEIYKLDGVDFTDIKLVRDGKVLRNSRELIIERMIELEITDAKGLGDEYQEALIKADLVEADATSEIMGVAAELKVAEGIISQEQAQSYGWLEKSYKSNKFLERYNASLEDGRVFVCDAHEVLPKFLKEANLEDSNLSLAHLDGADLRGADLRGADLGGADLRGADLTGADLTGADLTGASLRYAYLEGADLEGATLTGAILTGANLTGATVDAVSILQEIYKLDGVDFTDIKLVRDGKVLENSRELIIKRMIELEITDAKGLGDEYQEALIKADLVEADATSEEGIISQEQAQSYGWLEEPYKSNGFLERYNASLEDGKVFHCDVYERLPKFLKEANLEGSNLVKANLEGSNLTKSILKGAILRVICLRGADLGGADLGGADLGGAILTNAHLKGTNLKNAIMEGADLGGAILRGATLTGADLRSAILTGAYLEGADLTSADLIGADLTGATVGAVSILHNTDELNGVDFTGIKLVREGKRLRNSRELIIERMIELEITDAKGLGDEYQEALIKADLVEADTTPQNKTGIAPTLAARGFKIATSCTNFSRIAAENPNVRDASKQTFEQDLPQGNDLDL